MLLGQRWSSMPQYERAKYSCACRSAIPSAVHVTTAAACATDKLSWKWHMHLAPVHPAVGCTGHVAEHMLALVVCCILRCNKRHSNSLADILECCHQPHPQMVVLVFIMRLLLLLPTAGTACCRQCAEVCAALHIDQHARHARHVASHCPWGFPHPNLDSLAVACQQHTTSVFVSISGSRFRSGILQQFQGWLSIYLHQVQGRARSLGCHFVDLQQFQGCAFQVWGGPFAGVFGMSFVDAVTAAAGSGMPFCSCTRSNVPFCTLCHKPGS